MSSLSRFGHVIAGEPVAGQRWMPSYDPYLGEPWAEVAAGTADDVDAAVSAARRAYRDPAWRGLTPTARGALLLRLADLLAEHAEQLAVAETRDNGKLIAEMRAQMRYLPQWFRYFGGLADKVEGAVIPSDKPSMFNYTKPEPLGVVAAITPWNSPLLLTAWKLAPALAAGNTVVVKPSEFTSTSILPFLDLVARAGFPPGVINLVTGTGAEVGAALVEHPDVAAVAFTGGEASGRAVAASCGRKLIPATLELGGKSAQLVFADAILENAVKGVAGGIFAATGQTCVAGSRVLVERRILPEFLDRLSALAKGARMGDPMRDETEVGPVTTRQQLDRILGFIEHAKRDGAEVLIGGSRATRPECGQGWFVEPTIFTGVTPSMRIAQEEVFGPVACVIPFDSEEEAVAIANGTRFGLATGVWTRDLARAHRLAATVESGMVWVNTYRTSSPMSPFGGMKASGLGRENGAEAIRHYLQTKAVWMDFSETYPSPFVMRL
ncbi:aldehyde dehydrogenase [Falsiroseomonas sp. HW251]|uniref:aldehyde dehydrogenase n=1 Tax=Falsiroseomonas sp. HW251 TaxID=3390998 RepID=UPI003D30F159